MKKIIIYFISFMFLMIGLFIYLGHLAMPNIVHEEKGYQIASLDRSDLLKKIEPYAFFLLEEGKENNLYQVDYYHGGREYRLLKQSIENVPNNPFGLFVHALDHSRPMTDTIERIHIDALRKLIISNEVVAAGHLAHQYEGADLFGRIDSTVFIFFLLGIAFFVYFWILDGLIWLLNKVTGIEVRRIVEIVLVGAGIWLSQNLFMPLVLGLSPWIELLRAIIMFVPLYFIYDFVTKKVEKKFEWIDDVAIRFIILFFGSCFFFFLSDFVIRGITGGGQEQEYFGTSQFIIGLAFSFSFGNLLNHLRRQVFSLRSAKLQLKQSQDKALKSSSEFNALHSSINPHFLYNALNSISALAIKDPKKTQQMTMALSDFYKYTTNRQENNWTTVAEEMEMVKAYVEIEKIRFEDRLEVNILVNENLGKEEIPHFILQPIVENAIKYGYNNETAKMRCDISIKKEKDELIMEIADGGKPFDQNLQMGYGLKNVAKKLKLLYPQRHILEFVNDPKAVVIKLKQND